MRTGSFRENQMSRTYNKSSPYLECEDGQDGVMIITVEPVFTERL